MQISHLIPMDTLGIITRHHKGSSKKSFFSGRTTKRAEEGRNRNRNENSQRGKGRTTKKKELILKLKKNLKKVTTIERGGGQCLGGQNIKKNFFCGFVQFSACRFADNSNLVFITECPRSLVQLSKYTDYIKVDKTSWTCSTLAAVSGSTESMAVFPASLQ